jgi:hypothetical protein
LTAEPQRKQWVTCSKLTACANHKESRQRKTKKKQKKKKKTREEPKELQSLLILSAQGTVYNSWLAVINQKPI